MTGSLPPDALARLFGRDGSLFSDDPVTAREAEAFMGWIGLAARADEVVARAEALAADVQATGATDVVLLGMGGSSLAALVLGSLLPRDGRMLRVLDTTSPTTISRALHALDPERTLFVVASKSGTTIEPLALYAIFRQRADAALGRQRAGGRFIAITDAGSALEELATAEGFAACVSTPHDVGGRFSALTAFGLLPAVLSGADVRPLIEDARAAEERLARAGARSELADRIAAAHRAGADKLLLAAPDELTPFCLWVEQLVAESLGKHGTGILPVVVGHQPVPAGPDQALVQFGTFAHPPVEPAAARPVWRAVLEDPRQLGQWFIEWEYAVALLGSLLRVNPFDQPNVAEAKAMTMAVLEGGIPAMEPQLAVDGVEVVLGGRLPRPDHPERSIEAVLAHALGTLEAGDYLAILAYLPDDPGLLERIERAQARAMASLGRPVCVELGPRYLHSTGQFHKGGPDTGVFIVLATDDPTDLPVPGRPWSLRRLHLAQADGDLLTLSRARRRVLGVRLPDAEPATVDRFAAALERAAADRGRVPTH